MANLKELFPEFYQSKLDIKDLSNESENLLVLDTNYLLDIIQLPTTVSKKYIEALEKVKENIYIPYLVALEFNFKKSSLKKGKIKKIRKYKNEIEQSVVNIKKKNDEIDLVDKEEKEIFTNELLTMTEDYLAELKKIVDSKVSSMITEEENELYERLISVIENKVGNKYSQEWIDEIEKQGEERYEQNIPPGFNDSSKVDEIDSLRMYGDIKYCRKYGDLIIWKDIIGYSKEYAKMGKKVVFITNDGKAKQKRDLLYKVDDLTVGPNIHLMNELYMEANKELHILNNLRFVQLVNDLSDVEMNKLKKSSEKMYKVKIPHDQIEKERINLMKKNIENNEYELGISDDGYLFKKEKNHIDNLYNFAIKDIERKELKKYINTIIHDKDIEELYKMYLLNKLAESELKDYKQTEFYDKDDRSNKRSYDSKSRKSIFNFDDDLEENFDNEENE
ncbi:PIN-like domain-containing protein [Pseudolactococcus plantarum]|uniref:PIN like domain-containing protein n=1 Tax=Pseudolactococcus plantarum TaxID=1365 RepID=A0A2A5RYJ0_9LACT|nr:PIN-like domain-containing protein [Lactococcus plantarum]PCS06285.1 hypothetical protein RU87_GL001806 [Lactococcus plantarum]